MVEDLFRSVSGGSLSLLEDAAAVCQARNARGETLLHVARPFQVVSRLLELGVDPQVRDHQGRTPLMQPRLSTATMHLLLQAGVDPNARDKTQFTALYYVMDLLSGGIGLALAPFELAQFLIEHGADPNLGPVSLTALAYEMVTSGGEMNEARSFEAFLRPLGYTR